MESEKNTNAIDLQHLWKLFVQHVRMILIWTVGLGVIAWGIAAFVIPAKYTATITAKLTLISRLIFR